MGDTAGAVVGVHPDAFQAVIAGSSSLPARSQYKVPAAIELLRSWCKGDKQEQRETLEYLKRVLDEDRLSDRKLFPYRMN